MGEKELYQQKMKAQLDLWKAEVDKLKAKASVASSDAQLEMKKQISALEGKIDDGKNKLSALAEASEEAWHSMKDGVESAWSALKTAISDAAGKFKD
jgi:chromosome segregation ATPase